MNIALPFRFAKLFAALFIITHWNLVSLSAQPSIDSLRKALVLLPGDSSKVNTLNELSFEIIRSLTTSTEGKQIAEQAEALSKKIDFKKGLARAKYLIGIYYFYDSIDYNKSRLFLIESSKIYEKENNEVGYASALLMIGRTYIIVDDWGTAIPYLSKAAFIYENHSDSQTGDGFLWVSLLYSNIGRIDKALTYADKALGIYKKNKNYLGVCQATMWLGQHYNDNSQYENALSLLKQSKKTFDKYHINRPEAKISLGLGIAEAFIGLNQLDSAKFYYSKVEDQQKEVSDVSWNYHASFDLVKGRIATMDGRYNEAELLLNGVNLQKSNLEGLREADIFLYLSRLYEKMNDKNRALTFFKRYAFYKDSMKTARGNLAFDDLQNKLIIERQQKENETLKADLNAQQSRARVRLLLSLVGALVSILALTVVWILHQSRKKIRAQNILLHNQYGEIQAQNEEITASNEMIKVQSEDLLAKNRQLVEKSEMLAELNHEKDGIMSVIAHDLRAPLNKAKGLLKLIQSSPLPQQRQGEAIEKALEANEAGLILIADLLQVNSMEYENERLEYHTLLYKPINLGSFIVEEIIKPHEALAFKKNISLQSAVEDIIEIFTDSSMLKRILENLVSNALKFSGPGKRVLVSAHAGSEGITITVHDEGPGINSEDQKKMFRKFQRLSARPTGGEPSTGLGLAIVKSLVEKLAGNINVESQVGIGTEISITLKQHPPSQKS